MGCGKEAYKERNRRYFKRWAPLYDLIELLVGGVREEIVAMADPKPGERVLDMATGTGAVALAFARRGAEVVGADLSAEMLERARKKNGFTHARFIEADARELPFEDGGFDICVISFGLCTMPGEVRARALAEAGRVCKPGGRLLVADFDVPGGGVGRRVALRMIGSHRTVEHPESYGPDLERMIESSGFPILERRRVLRGVARILLCRSDA